MDDPIVTIASQDSSLVGMRLDMFMFTHYPHYSRTYFQQIIKDGLVTINNHSVTKVSYMLKLGDTVTFKFPPEKQYDLTPTDVHFDIIDIQDDFVIINKPAGLTVHNAESNKEEITLVHGLLYRFKELAQFTDNQRPGIVHRLDKDTSGLILVARNVQGHIELARMFAGRQMNKTYLALVKGRPEAEGSIDYPIGRHKVHRHKMSHQGICSRDALTYYSSLVYYDESALIAARIVTGRTHQIRVHCAAINHPVIGDAVYGTKSKFIDRQALHSWKLSFAYKGKQFDYVCPVPDDIKQCIIKTPK